MKKATFIIIFIFLLLTPSLSTASEVIYPELPGVVSPGMILEDDFSDEEEVYLFFAYIFTLLLYAALSVGGAVFIYGGILYITAKGDSQKVKNAKEWMIGAVQGTFIMLISHLILTSIDSHFLIFNLKQLERQRDRAEETIVDWEREKFYFQIPYGLLVEDAAVNEKARDKLYDIIDATYDAEDTADAILHGGKDLLDIIDVCPVGDECCDDEPFCEWPPIPFAALQRTKPARVSFDCFWDNHATRSGSRVTVPRPPLRIFSGEEFDLSRDLDSQKTMMREVIRDLQVVVDEYFDEHLRRENPLWELRERLSVLVIKMQKLRDYQSRMINFTDEAREIARETEILAEDFPIILEPPFRDVIMRMIVEWDDSSVLANWGKGHDDVPFVEQFAIDWRHVRYAYGTLGHSGCLLASTVMVLNDYGVDTTIFEAMNFSLRHGHNALHGGTFEGFAPHFIGYKGLSSRMVSFPSSSHMSYMINWLENEGPIIVMGKYPPWSSGGGGHALVLSAVNRERQFFYMNNTSAPFINTATFGQVASNMPDHIVYVSRRASSNLQQSPLARKSLTDREVLSNGGDGSCPDCPEISCAVMAKIGEITIYTGKHYYDLWVMYFSKDMLKEDVYHLYKTLMLKSLGMNNIIDYTKLLRETIYHDDSKRVFLDTDEDYTKIYRYGRDRSNPYTWDWTRWISDENRNIAYTTTVYKDGGCQSFTENDPITFYLERPVSDSVIKDALFMMAYRKKQEDLQKLDGGRISLQNDILKHQLAEVREIRDSIEEELFFSLFAIASADEGLEEIRRCLERSGRDLMDISLEEFYQILLGCGINLDVQEEGAGDHLRCGMEIPVGETFDIIWDHFRELLFVIDAYVAEGLTLLELQNVMHEMAMMCSCPCQDPCCECDPDPACGFCFLTCDKMMINAFYYQEIVPQRAKMKRIAAYIEHLTRGFFEHPTENLCHYLNEDVRQGAEVETCKRSGSLFATKHELVTRKLNYSRREFDLCYTPISQSEDVVLGESHSGELIFGAVAEQLDLERYTKTKKQGVPVNTSNFNWFCCRKQGF